MMTKRILSLAAACALAFAGSAATDAEAAAGQPGVDRPLKVLMIGNSFSVCVLKQMPQIAADLGCKLDLCSLYIGGCPLVKHAKNLAATNGAYGVTWNYMVGSVHSIDFGPALFQYQIFYSVTILK